MQRPKARASGHVRLRPHDGLNAPKWHHHANAITPNWNRPMKISHCDLTTSNNAVWDYLRQPVASESHFSASWTSPQKVVVLLTQRRGSGVLMRRCPLVCDVGGLRPSICSSSPCSRFFASRITRSAQPKGCVPVMQRPKARASGHVRLRTSRRCSTQRRSSAWTARLCSKPRSSARCPQWCSSNTMELHAVKVVPAYGDGHGLCSEA